MNSQTIESLYVENKEIAKTEEKDLFPSMYLEAKSIFDCYNKLKSQEIFNQSGVFLSDSDYTLRQSVKDFLSGYPDRLDLRVQEIVLEIHQKDNWDVAIITDQPDKGHQIARVAGKLKNYDPLLKFCMNNNIDVLGGYNDPVRFVLKEKGQYKKHQRAIDETMEMLERKNYKERENIVWVGDTMEDVDFGMRLEKKIREDGYKGHFYLVKITERSL